MCHSPYQTPGFKAWMRMTRKDNSSTHKYQAMQCFAFLPYCVSQERNSCNNSPLMHPLNLSSLLLGQDETTTAQILLSTEKIATSAQARQSLSLCCLIRQLRGFLFSLIFVFQKFIKLVKDEDLISGCHQKSSESRWKKVPSWVTAFL